MPLKMYRRHNPANCAADKDSEHCYTVRGGKILPNTRKPCPVWVRGMTADERYIRQPLQTRDWTRGIDLAGELEATGIMPQSPKKEPASATIETWQSKFVEDQKSRNIAESTRRKYEVLFRQLIAFAKKKGIRHAAGLSAADLREFRNSWKDNALSKSRKQDRLRKLFKFAISEKWVSENPATGLERIRIEHKQKLPFTDEEMDRILKAARQKGADVYTFILTMRYSGLRISDVCMLRVESLEGRHLTLRTAKTGTPVKVLLPGAVSQSLRSIKPKSPEYFFSRGHAKLNSITGLWQKKLIPVFKAAKVDNGHSHRLRHTFATKLLKQGVPTLMVATLLGNTEQIVIKHYSAWIESRQKGLDDAVEKANGYHHIAPV